jgi:hypothetical protein
MLLKDLESSGDFCPIWEICARFEKKMADCLQLILSLREHSHMTPDVLGHF